MKDMLCDALNARFVASQLLNPRRYELSRPTIARLRPDGSGDVFAELQSEQLRASAGVVGRQTVDANGTITFDSRAEQREHESRLADRIGAHVGDELLGRLLASFQRAVDDSNNELVHLYEIRDALSMRFGCDTDMRATLGVSRGDWSRLGDVPPLLSSVSV
jgi:hypothetical protein